MQDWIHHPITRNFTTGVKDVIKMYKESLSEMDSDFNVREVARKIGIVQGLEALLTYDPEFDEKGNLVTEEDEINL